MAVLGLPSQWTWLKSVSCPLNLHIDRLFSVAEQNLFGTCSYPFSICVPLQDDNYGAEEVQNLRSLVLNLRQLLDLHRKYNCRLSLSVFEKVFIHLLFQTCAFEHHMWKHLRNHLNPVIVNIHRVWLYLSLVLDFLWYFVHMGIMSIATAHTSG